MKIQVSGINIPCAHFIEVDGIFETLHGHNLMVSAEVEGEEREGLVMDFRDLEKLLEKTGSKVDHRVIIPKDNPYLKISHSGGYFEILACNKRYRIPETDVALLPIGNSTVEEIGRFFYNEVIQGLPEGLKLNFVSVQEIEGKRALVSLT